MWRLADHQIDEFVADGRCEFITAYAQPFAMLVVADLLGVPEEDHQRFREGFGLSGTVGEVGVGGGRQPRRQPPRLARRVVRHLHRGPAARAPQGRAHRPGAGDLPGRERPRRHVGGADLDLPVRRRAGDHRPPARGRAEAPRRAPRAAGRAARRPGEDPELPRGGAAGGEPGEDRLPPHPPHHRGRRRRGQGRARRSCSSTAPPTATPAASSARTSSGSTDPTPPPTWRSAGAPTRARAARWPGRRAGSSLERILERTRNIRLSEEHHGPTGARRFHYEPTWILRGLTSCTSSSTRSTRRREPGRRRHRRRVRHRARDRASSSPPTATPSPSSTATERASRRPPPSSRTTGTKARRPRGRRGGSGLGRRRVRRGPRRRSDPSASSSRAPASSRSPRSVDITPDSWDRIIAVNLTGTFACVQAAVPDMLDAGWGRIVTISSSSAQSGAPNMAHYAASKGGVISLTRALAVELARQGHHRQHDLAEPRRHPDGAGRRGGR